MGDLSLSAVAATDLFVGSAAAPLQVIRVTLRGGPEPVRVRLDGPTVTTPEPVLVTGLAPGEERTVDVGVRVAAPAPTGSVHRVTAIAETDSRQTTMDGQIEVADTGWTMWMVSHFHYDPVWWNTQAGFTEAWYDLPVAEARRPDFNRTAFDLVRAHLEAARHDEDYRFVLAEIDYLKPYWDVFPADRADLRRFLREGRVELVGGTYNEPNTNLTHPESTIRNAVYGIGYQRDVLGGDPRSAWMLDVFGHDPSFPGLMADAGLDSSAWARGPFHHIGPKRHTGDITRAQFPSEFEWISPSGRGLLTSYMANHYVAGWDMERRDTLDEAMAEAYAQFSELKRVAATRHVLLPVGHDHNIPSRWCTEVHRHWAKRYVWPRFVVGLPRDFFAAVRAELAAAGRSPSPQTRDMNPVYTGKDVSYIDTKQAQRAAEVAVLDAERLSTVATLLGAPFPAEALDKAWRQLAYGAHHDAITGTESDQVYLDLLGGWREAYELGEAARRSAATAIAAHADTGGPGRALFAVNSLSWPRDGVATVRLAFPRPGPAGVALRDDDGNAVAAVAEGVRRHEDGTLAEATLTFLARDVPALGYRVFRAVDAPATPAGWVRRPDGAATENEAFRIEADPARGGALSRIVDRRTGRNLLRAGGIGGALIRQEEHETHPVYGEGPWHLLPKGPGHGAGTSEVFVEECPIGSRLVAVLALGDLRIRQEAVLWDGVDRIDFRTHVDGSIGQDHLLRVRFDLDLPGALPVAEVGFAAVGRSFGFPDSDAATDLWTLDSPAHTWAGLSAPARIALVAPDGTRREHAIGVAEVVAPEDGGESVRTLLARLASLGVTATRTLPDGPRYGALDADSNLPDVRIALGAGNSFAERVLDAAGPAYRAALARNGAVFVPAARTRRESWTPGADLRGARDLPVLVVAGTDLDVTGPTIEVAVPDGLDGTGEPLDDYSVALVNQGTPSFVAAPDGTFFLSLMRSCSAWPSGVWIDGPRRTAPDGSSFAWQHWTHTFRYSLVAGPGDWRRAGFVGHGQEVNHPVRVDEVPVSPGTGTLPPEERSDEGGARRLPGAPSERSERSRQSAGALPSRLSLGSVEPRQVVLSALKPRGNPMAAGGPGRADVADGVTMRLYEATGAPATARVRLHGGLLDVARADLLEAESGRPVAVDGADAVVDVAPAEAVTLTARPAHAPVGDGGRVPATEPAQPVYTRYWLHNKGPAPVGYLPVSVHIEPSVVSLAGPVTVRVRVAAASRVAAGVVELDVPDGLVANPAGPMAYDLGAGDYAEFAVSLRADGAAPGTYFVAARIRDDLGQVLEDVVAVTVGAASPPLEVSVEPAGLRLAPGERGVLAVRLANRARSEIRGEVQLLSPYGTWGGPDPDVSITPWTRGFAAPPGGSTEARYVVQAPAAARTGGTWWAVAKVAYFGHVYYTPAVSIETESRSRDGAPSR